MVTQTSRGAYRGHVISGKARTQRGQIYQLILKSAVPLNRRQISSLLQIPINAVCGRVNSLIKSDAIKVAFVSKDPVTDKRVEYLQAVWPQKQRRMF